MSRYYKDGQEVICSRAEYIEEMQRRAEEAAAPKPKPKKRAAKKGAK